jgi:conjugative transfer region protein (TIGR03750 family)
MAASSQTSSDTLVTFLPHRLNRQPVIVRGLTADELWTCVGLSAAFGFVLGLPLAWITRSVAMVPTLMVAGIGFGVFAGGGLLRACKRGRPDTWLYRQLQWQLALRYPMLAVLVGGRCLITRSGYWTTRRTTQRIADRRARRMRDMRSVA